jgi:hypothetical protein
VKIQRAVARYHRLERGYDFEDHRTFEEFLGPLPPAVREIFSCAAQRATAELDELSAGCGIGLFALVWGGKGSLIARNLLGGTGQLPAAMGRELGERARTGCRVQGIRPDGAELVVELGGEEVRARQVIMAAQAPHAAPLVAPVAAHAAVGNRCGDEGRVAGHRCRVQPGAFAKSRVSAAASWAAMSQGRPRRPPSIAPREAGSAVRSAAAGTAARLRARMSSFIEITATRSAGVSRPDADRDDACRASAATPS